MSAKQKPNLSTAKLLGSIAFAKGIICAPCADKELMETFAGRNIGDKRSVHEMKAWIKGWTEANLATNSLAQ